jgi:hypothetical protein
MIIYVIMKKTFFTPPTETTANDLAEINRRLTRSEPGAGLSANRVKTKYLFIGLSACAGTTTLAMAFAEYLASRATLSKGREQPRTRADAGAGGARTAFVELSDGAPPYRGFDYDRIGMDRHFAGREYISFYRLLTEGRPVKACCNADGGVNWALRIPGERLPPICSADLTRLFCDIQGDDVVGDLSGSFARAHDSEHRREETRRLLNAADRIIAIVDPSPSAMMADTDKFMLLRGLAANAGKPVLYLINKMNAGVDRREMKKFLKLRDFEELKFFPPETLYAAEYDCRTLMSHNTTAQQLAEVFARLAG